MSQAPAPSNKPVLVVSANVERRERLYDVLAKQGFAVLTMHSAEHAMKALKNQVPCVAVTDAALPDSPGLALAQNMRQVHAQLPIIMIGAVVGQAPNGLLAAILAEPLDEAALVQSVMSHVKAAKPAAARERWPGHVLIVDDDPRCRFLLQEFLEVYGLTVQAAESGEAAVKHVEQHSPSVVILDVKMSGMDGLVTLKKIKALKPTTTVFMLTGLEEETTMQQAMALGAFDYITKPFSREYLETALLSKILLGRT